MQGSPTRSITAGQRVLTALGFLAALGLVGCGQAAPGAATGPSPAGQNAEAGKPTSWSELVDAAKKEGTITVIGPQGTTRRHVLVDDFQAANPGIKVLFTGASFTDEWSRISAERAAGKYLLDVVVGAASGGPLIAKPAGALAPLQPLLTLPEVLDTSKWFKNHLWWEDEHDPHTSLAYQTNVQLIMAYNKNQVTDPQQFTSYQQLLDPKWKGKMVATDIRPGQVGGVSARFLYREPGFGPDFLSRLFGDMNVTVSADQRQLVDWLGSGQFSLGLFLSPDPTVQAINQGLPIGYIPGEQFKEGAPLGPSRGTIDVMDKAPHPNATKLFVNWLLSSQGQTAWQSRFKAPSLRVDVPKDQIFPLFVPKAEGKYVDGGTESFNDDATRAAMQDLIDQAMKKAKSSGSA